MRSHPSADFVSVSGILCGFPLAPVHFSLRATFRTGFPPFPILLEKLILLLDSA
jgi:hypothetical protein